MRMGNVMQTKRLGRLAIEKYHPVLSRPCTKKPLDINISKRNKEILHLLEIYIPTLNPLLDTLKSKELTINSTWHRIYSRPIIKGSYISGNDILSKLSPTPSFRICLWKEHNGYLEIWMVQLIKDWSYRNSCNTIGKLNLRSSKSIYIPIGWARLPHMGPKPTIGKISSETRIQAAHNNGRGG